MSKILNKRNCNETLERLENERFQVEHDIYSVIEDVVSQKVIEKFSVEDYKELFANYLSRYRTNWIKK